MNQDLTPDHADTKSNLALMLEIACEQYEMAANLIAGRLRVDNVSASPFQGARAHSVIIMALAKEFIFNARRAERIIEKGKGQLKLNRGLRKQFLNKMKTVVFVRDVNEHGFEIQVPKKTPVKRPSLHFHDGDQFALDETAMVISNNEIYIGPLKLSEIYNSVAEMRKLAGFESLPKTKF